MAGNSPNYDALLDQIQTLSDMQRNGNLHAADPVKQAAYMKRLQQQAESIKKMLKLLNNSRAAEFSTTNSNRASNSDFTRKSGDFNAVNFGEIRQINEGGGWRGEDTEHYEQLWELSTSVNEYDVPEVGVDEDILDEEEEGLVESSVDNWEENLYENTSITAANLTLSVEVPPPLPPRLPSRSNLNQASDNSNALAHSDRNSQSGLSDRNSQSIHSDRNSQPSQRSATQSESSKSSKPNRSSNKCNDVNFDKFSVGGLNCSTPHPALPSLSNRSCVTSTPKEFGGGQTIKGSSGNSRSKTELLQKKREELIASLQAEEQERQWYYTQLELIAQKIRNIPLSSLHSYSLENEAARQELEDRAARVQASMQRQLGDAEQVSRDRRHKVQQVRAIDAELAEMDRVELRGEHELEEGVRRNVEDGGGARRAGHPQSCNLEQLYHESIPMDRALSHSGPPAFGGSGEDTTSVISFTSSVHSVGERGGVDAQDSSSLMALLGCTDVEKMSKTLLAMSSSPTNCDMMRSSRCIPLLVQLLHLDHLNPNLPRPSRHVRARAARCLHNIVHAHPTDKHCKREAKVLKLLEILRQYCDLLRDILSGGEGRGGGNSRAAAQAAGCRRVSIQVVEGGEKYQEQDLMVADFGNIGEGYSVPCKQVYACQHFLDFSGEARQAGQVINIEESMAVLTRCSFDESHRQPIFLLGGIPALAELIQVEHGLHPSTHSVCREVRRYAVVALTNLTFGNTGIKSYLCQFPGLVDILVGQLESQWENLRKATAHLFRNLAWKADKSSKSVLSECGVVRILMGAAMTVAERCLVETTEGLAVEPGREEPTLKVILSALWNLSAHCRKNKSEVCSTPGSLVLLVQFLRSRSTAIIENGGGILRNISSYIATSQQGEEYRKILRDEECLSLLLTQLRSPSLTIVSNACGTLWNFSARNKEDQEKLWELGAVPMLQSLTNSKHKTISTCSLAALKNLYTARPTGLFMMVSGVPGQLTARKVKNLVADLDEKLSDCGGRDVEEGQDSPGNSDESGSETEERQVSVARSDSRNSVSSVPSVTSHYSEGRDRSSASPERKGEKVFFSGAAFSNLTRSGYNTDNSRHSDKQSGYTSDSPPPLPKRGEGGGFKGGLSAEGRFDGNYKSYMKQFSDPNPRQGSPLRDNYVESDGERVMSPTKLNLAATVLSPGSIPLDLSKKKPAFTDEAELCEEKPTDYSLRFQESEDLDLIANKAGDKSEQLFDDSVKTYYTEGTPMDTPYVFSTATSMSDLREPAILEEEEEEEETEKQGDSTTAYAVEGTPITFSRAESLSSLESGEVDGVGEGTKLSAIPENGEEKGMQETEGTSEKERGHTPPPPKDHKTVTFRGGDNSNANDTPLLFSRASSVASLDSFDQQSIPDGYSSCDFSRATSGRVSPSDLPDSPSQTMPSSPRRMHTAPPRPNKNTKPPLAPQMGKPMFADEVRAFNEEGTPANFSTRTSLSGLCLDEEEEEGMAMRNSGEKVKTAWPENRHDESIPSEEEDIYADSESLLDQIISSGMPNSKSEKSKQSKLPHRMNPVESILNESGGGSDDSVCSAESTDILQACIEFGMPSKTKISNPVSKLAEFANKSNVKPTLGPRQAGEGAPAMDLNQKSRKQIPQKSAKLPERRGATAPPPPERRGSHLSHPCVAAAAACTADLNREPIREQESTFRYEGSEELRSYRVEDTPINFSAATSISDLFEEESSSRLSVDSNDGLLEHKRNRRGNGLRSRLASEGRGVSSPQGGETPLHYATEDTPAVFSRNDSLSSLEYEDQNLQKGPAPPQPSKGGSDGTFSWGVASSTSFQSHLPRPLTVGRSASSGSSTGVPDKPKDSKPNKSFNSSLSSLSIDSLNNTNDDEENLLADCISSGMPKSKSEHFDLSGKFRAKKSPRREKSASVEREKRRPASKSPRGSRLIPGVVIPELKLKPRTPPKSRPQSGEMQIFNLKSRSPSPSTESEMKPDQRTEPEKQEARESKPESPTGNFNMEDEPEVLHHSPIHESASNQVEEMTLTLTQSRISDMEGFNSSLIAREAGVVAASFDLSEYPSLTGSMYSEGGETLSMVQPPSLMLESLPSLSMPFNPPPVTRRTSDVKLECRHTLSGKLGSSVPLAVRRALGGSGSHVGSVSQEDLSSLSSCYSNLDNIRPPTIMDDLDMENSMVSVASISSEVAAALAGSGGSDDTSHSMTSEAILDIVRPAGAAVEAFSRERSISMGYSLTSLSGGLEAIEPPTCLEDITLVNSNTLVPVNGETFVVDEAGDTCADVTDVFDEESMIEPTLTTGSDAVDGEVPELPRDSRRTTPAQSGGESSVETTPLPARKLSPKEKRQMDPERYLTFTKSNESTPRTDSCETSGYKSQETNQGREQRSSRQQRLIDETRFKTRTISKEDLVCIPIIPTNPEQASPKTLKQRRAEEAERFKTQTIHPSDLLSPQEVAILESEARLVVQTITEQKASARSRSTSVDLLEENRSRSASVEILREFEMMSIDSDMGSVASKENLLDIQDDRLAPEGEENTAIPKPRICKPWESRIVAEDIPAKGVRGRRRVLYSPPMKRATVPPAIPPKPTQSKSRANSSPVTSPKLVRGTRAMALRQANAAAKKETGLNSPPRSLNNSGSSIGSTRSPSIGSPKSRTSGSRGSRTQSPASAEKPALVRQGTFTKDESPKTKTSGIPRQSPPNSSTSNTANASNIRQGSNVSLRGTGAGLNRTPPKIAPKPSMFRRDVVQPLPTPKPVVTTTKTQQLREKSLTRGGLRSSNSSTSSVASKTSTVSKTSIRTSSSSHSLRSAAENIPRRTPSSSEIERRIGYGSRPLSPTLRTIPGSNIGRPLSPQTRALSPVTKPASSSPEFKKPVPKKDVTSKIASLWKKVEDSKKQKKDSVKDKRVWISKGKVQQETEVPPPPPGRLIRSGTYEKLSESNPSTDSKQTDLKETKPRSRSRLSIKLSKFGLKRKGNTEDQVNGNTPVSPDELSNSIASEMNSPNDETLLTPEEFLQQSSPVDPEPGRSESSESMSTGPDHDTERRSHPPFAYPSNPVKSTVVKRNTSYVSSLGRKAEGIPSDESDGEKNKKKFSNTSSSVVTLV